MTLSIAHLKASNSEKPPVFNQSSSDADPVLFFTPGSGSGISFSGSQIPDPGFNPDFLRAY
jgi:hypothetical protein